MSVVLCRLEADHAAARLERAGQALQHLGGLGVDVVQAADQYHEVELRLRFELGDVLHEQRASGQAAARFLEQRSAVVETDIFEGRAQPGFEDRLAFAIPAHRLEDLAYAAEMLRIA